MKKITQNVIMYTDEKRDGNHPQTKNLYSLKHKLNQGEEKKKISRSD